MIPSLVKTTILGSYSSSRCSGGGARTGENRQTIDRVTSDSLKNDGVKSIGPLPLGVRGEHSFGQIKGIPVDSGLASTLLNSLELEAGHS